MMMRLSALVWALVLFAASLTSAQKYPITGVKVSGSAVPMRRNINSLYSAGGPTWDLYVRSLGEMYKESPNNQLSFFQIAAIHGQPYIQWNSAGAGSSNGWQGYCPHGESIFLTWHRPYVLLFEMRLVETAKRLANGYPSSVRAKYQSAAAALRSPFWDWAGSPSVPPATVPAKLKVKIPSGSTTRTVEVENPLRYYHFPQAALNGQFGSFRPGAQIYKCRAPDSYPRSANALMSERPYKRWVYDALTRSQTFDQFASTGSSGASLESIHNAIHWDGSCGQQFLAAEFSAFDPLFMLHHTQVDRLWAYWSAIKPSERVFKNSYRGGSRFNTREGSTITPNSPLQPFFQANGQFHTSNSVQSIKGFGYHYQGLEYWKKSDAQMARDATALMNKWYGPGVNRVSKRDDQTLTRYFVQLQVDVEELTERPVQINAYVDNIRTGSMVVMKQPATGILYSKYDLDRVAAPADVSNGEVVDTVDSILSTIRLEIVKHDGSTVPIESVPSLKATIENVDVVPPSNEFELPEYKDPKQRTAPKRQQRRGRH